MSDGAMNRNSQKPPRRKCISPQCDEYTASKLGLCRLHRGAAGQAADKPESLPSWVAPGDQVQPNSAVEEKSDDLRTDLSNEEIDQLARLLRAHGFEGPPDAEAALRKAHGLGFDVFKIQSAYAARGRFDSRYVLSNAERRLLLEFDTLSEEMRAEIKPHRGTQD